MNDYFLNFLSDNTLYGWLAVTIAICVIYFLFRLLSFIWKSWLKARKKKMEYREEQRIRARKIENELEIWS